MTLEAEATNMGLTGLDTHAGDGKVLIGSGNLVGGHIVWMFVPLVILWLGRFFDQGSWDGGSLPSYILANSLYPAIETCSQRWLVGASSGIGAGWATDRIQSPPIWHSTQSLATGRWVQKLSLLVFMHCPSHRSWVANGSSNKAPERGLLTNILASADCGC